MASRQRLKRSLVALLVVCSVAVTCTANDLNDSMQLYFKGDYKRARERLSKSIGEGHVDARSYYFRGLASYHLGDLAAATADFRTGAQLETRGLGKGAGQALQRIQGIERLQLEKHRRLAKLKARQRRQSTTPRPITRRDIRRINGAAVGLTTRQRLASEVPLSEGLQPDPFTDDPSDGFVAPAVPTVKSMKAQDQPVGTGVAKGSNLAEFTDAEEDPFGRFNDLEPNVRVIPSAAATDPSGAKTLRVFAAIVRAVRKATIPQVDPRGFVPDGWFGGPPAGSEDVFGEFEDNFHEDESGFPTPPDFGDADSTKVPLEKDDPFGDLE